MQIVTRSITIQTKGNPDLVDITLNIEKALRASKLKAGNITVFVVGSTAGITTFEYEPGLIKDMQDLYEKLISSDKHYKHDATWGDANGFSHLRSALQGVSLTIPFQDAKPLLGTWQQIVLAEFDNKPRARNIIIQFIGE